MIPQFSPTPVYYVSYNEDIEWSSHATLEEALKEINSLRARLSGPEHVNPMQLGILLVNSEGIRWVVALRNSDFDVQYQRT